jgi:2-polyprenyl-6-methoxyphenol hydroxylase-like FAD-dependent oxidoreductase
MATVVVTGGGLIGLSTAMLLAGDGHDVTVLERDASPPPPTAAEAWDSWERRGVNQFRLLHFLLSRVRQILEAELTDVVPSLEALGALRMNPFDGLPAELTGGWRDGDDDFELITARRPVAEAAFATVAAATPGVCIRRGVAVRGLLTGPAPASGVLDVTGVVTEAGEEIPADLVIDAGGRRSAMSRMLVEAGGQEPREEIDDAGFVYYGRHFRSSDGSTPPAFGPLLQAYDSLSTLTLPADNGVWSLALITSSKDPVLRRLRDTDTWTRVLGSYPLVAHWLDGEPLDDQVVTLSKLEDRQRWYVVDGSPVATGVLAVGDAWACTNPSVGRGISIGLIHAVALRDLLRKESLDDPITLALAWEHATAATAEPYVRSTLNFDRHRLAEIDAQIEGRPYEPGDPAWHLGQCLAAGATSDPDLLRGVLRIATALATGEEVMMEPGMADKALAVGEPLLGERAPGPTRAQLVALVEG